MDEQALQQYTEAKQFFQGILSKAFEKQDIENILINSIISLIQKIENQHKDDDRQIMHGYTQIEGFIIDNFDEKCSPVTIDSRTDNKSKSVNPNLLFDEMKLIKQKFSCLQQQNFNQEAISFSKQLQLLQLTPYDVKRILANSQRLLLIYDVYYEAEKSNNKDEWSKVFSKENTQIKYLEEIFKLQKQKIQQYGPGQRETFLREYISISRFPHLQKQFGRYEQVKQYYMSQQCPPEQEQ